MRSMSAAIVVFIATCASAQAQTPAPTAGAKSKQATAAARPALQTPSDTANAMGQSERMSIQADLAWVGQYNGAITGDVSERMVEAIKEYQKASGGRPTGVLNPKERMVLAETGRRRRENAGWKIVTDAASGVQLGIPTKLVPQQTSDANGTKWSSPTGTIQVLLTRRKEANPTTAKLADREKKEPAGRAVDYTVVKPDFFVLSGLQGLKKFYVRGTFKGDEVRILTILYDQATENTVEPVVIAMSSAFNPFPVKAAPPPRKTVEYGTGVVVSEDGAIVADRQVTDECLAITVPPFGNADRIAEDKEHDLALLRVYGAHGLKPLSLTSDTADKASIELIGISDPQNQSGGRAASTIKAAVTPAGSGGDLALSPTPAAGFSGAAARDDGGKFAGLALLKPAVATGAASAQSVLVSAAAVREFLKANGVSAYQGANDAASAVVRVICVRK
ncbi:MAG TPA: serine protease [Bradyrhizobium sp.]|uniref:serine protease n=1 Tax=Bradyrhizobium sp. TaxID=376 RepID=UPI002D7EDCA5|nr:serine protease [Bradyrhizobium sp.]HET7885509.1 serine protease [Bradyrhizobium sp.]